MSQTALTEGRPFDPFASRRRGVAVVFALLLAVAVAMSLGMGAVEIPADEVLSVVARKVGLNPGVEPAVQVEAVVWSIRLPRALMGILVGGALALTGVVLQGVFRNPMADPQLLGIGPGASLGGVIGSVAGATPGAIAGGAVAGLLTALVVRRLGARRANQPSRFILTGVALSAALSAWVGFVVFGADRAKVPPIEFWLLGSLTGSTWRALSTAVLLIGLGGIGLWTGARILDLMALGESEARHLGVDVEFATTVLLMGTGIVTGAAVGAVGVVGFVGLLVPHVVRKLTGPAHRPLMLGSVLAGGLFVVATDLVARTVFVPIEIPVGLVTAVVGGPFFLWLIRKARY